MTKHEIFLENLAQNIKELSEEECYEFLLRYSLNGLERFKVIVEFAIWEKRRLKMFGKENEI